MSDSADYSSQNSNLSDSDDTVYQAGGFVHPTSPSTIASMTDRSSNSSVLGHVFSPQYSDRDFSNTSSITAPHLAVLADSGRRLSSGRTSRLINYLDEQLLRISRRYVRKFSISADREPTEISNTNANTGTDASSDTVPYSSADQLVEDLSHLIDLIWFSISETPQSFMQTQYFLDIADRLNDYIPNLPIEDPAHVYSLLAKLDLVFYNLVTGENIPSGRRMSQTEKTRLESIVERSRVDLTDPLSQIPGHEFDLMRIYDRVLEQMN
ncbi:uncharacterized protein V1516DRAFT_341859 [Lipomyces oligophaga]|uniref:uncharacterized protein n=1 Tax=Lipomyces oligophaga TaxID=45792 RepID=UPI0034CFB8D7